MTSAVRACWGEALANLRATPYRFVLVGLVLASALSYVGCREAATVHDLGQRKAELRSGGQGIVVASTQVPVRGAETTQGLPGPFGESGRLGRFAPTGRSSRRTTRSRRTTSWSDPPASSTCWL